MSDEYLGEKQISFIRQRRNIITISATILIVEWAGVHFTSLSAQGLTMTVDNPFVIHYALWILWGYWLYRYYLFYKESEGQHQFEDVRRTKRLELVERKFSLIVKLDPTIAKQIEAQEADGSHQYVSASYDTISPREYTPGEYAFGLTGYIFNIPRLTLAYSNKKGGAAASSSTGERTLIIPTEKFRPYERRAYWSAVLQTKFITEYWLPFILSPFVLVVILWKVVTIAITCTSVL